jgi:hypothetical protein
VITEEGKVLDTAKVTRVPMGTSGIDTKGKKLQLHLAGQARCGPEDPKAQLAAAEQKVRQKVTARQSAIDWSVLRSVTGTALTVTGINDVVFGQAYRRGNNAS